MFITIVLPNCYTWSIKRAKSKFNCLKIWFFSVKILWRHFCFLKPLFTYPSQFWISEMDLYHCQNGPCSVKFWVYYVVSKGVILLGYYTKEKYQFPTITLYIPFNFLPYLICKLCTGHFTSFKGHISHSHWKVDPPVASDISEGT